MKDLTADWEASHLDVDYWDHDEGSETLTHDNIVCAIEFLADGSIDWKTPGALMGWIAEATPLRVYAWQRRSIGEDDIVTLTNAAVRGVIESYDEYLEALADPDESFEDSAEDELKLVERDIRASLAKHLSNFKPCGCELVGYVELSAERLLALLKAECPEWFAKDDSVAEVARG